MQRVADLEEHQQGGKYDSQRLRDLGRAILAAVAGEQPGGKAEGQGRGAIAEQQPVENRPRAEIVADDARIPRQPRGDDEAHRCHRVTQGGDGEARFDKSRAERRQRQRHGEHAAIEREGQAERQRRERRRGHHAEREAVVGVFGVAPPEGARGGEKGQSEAKRDKPSGGLSSIQVRRR